MKTNHASVDGTCEPPASPARCSLAAGSAGSIRVPFRVSLHDDIRQYDVGIFWVDVPLDDIRASIPEGTPGGHWEQISRMEKYAAESLKADLECAIDIDAFSTLPNVKGEPRLYLARRVRQQPA